MDKSVAIEVKNVSKRYKINAGRAGDLRSSIVKVFQPRGWFGKNRVQEDFWALEDLNFKVNRGEVLGVIGPNGAGKSTLLKILSKITEPTAGRIILNGRVSALLEVGTGFHPELTGRENVFLNGSILGMRRREIRSKLDEIIDFSGVKRFIDTPVKHYSSGMYVRLAFSVAAHLEPEILLIDEVLAVGDTEFQKKCLGRMNKVAQEGRTVVFVSHHLDLVRKIAHRGIYLQDGRIHTDDSMDHAIQAYLHQYDRLSTNDLSSNSNRRGNGKVRIQSIAFVTKDKGASSFIASGDFAQLQLSYVAIESVLGFYIECFIYNHLGHLCIYTCNVQSDDFFQIKCGHGTLYCTFPKLPLNAGVYSLTYRCYSKDQNFRKTLVDQLEPALTFQVEKGYFYPTGLLPNVGFGTLVEYQWESS